MTDDTNIDGDALMAHLQSEMRAGQRYPVPDEETKFQPGAEYTEAPDLEVIAGDLIEKYPMFMFLQGANIIYRWKRNGGKDSGLVTLGRTKRVTGELKHETGAVYYIWLAADHLRELQFMHYQVEGVMFHELKHCRIDEKGKFVLSPHDFEGFHDELRYYGPYIQSLQNMTQAMRQMSLGET